MSALDAIAAGADIVLVTGVEVQTLLVLVRGRLPCSCISLCSSTFIDDFTFPALFGRRAKAYRAKYGVSADQLMLFRQSLYQCKW